METSYSNLRARLASILDRVVDDQEAVIVRCGRPGRDVALISAAEWASLSHSSIRLALGPDASLPSIVSFTGSVRGASTFFRRAIITERRPARHSRFPWSAGSNTTLWTHNSPDAPYSPSTGASLAAAQQ